MIEDIVLSFIIAFWWNFVEHFPISANMVSHRLSFYSLSASVEFSGIDKTPLLLSDFVSADLAQ